MMTHRLPPWHRRRGKETVEKACVYLHRDRGSTGEPAENARPDHNRTDVLASDFEKQDRTLRLMRELVLFQAIPRGLTSRDVAERMGISQRQAQRDIKALEQELEVPFQQIGAR